MSIDSTTVRALRNNLQSLARNLEQYDRRLSHNEIFSECERIQSSDNGNIAILCFHSVSAFIHNCSPEYNML